MSGVIELVDTEILADYCAVCSQMAALRSKIKRDGEITITPTGPVWNHDISRIQAAQFVILKLSERLGFSPKNKK
jgi:phage terminase small subunit